jgi:hypothetical protein
MTTTERQLTGDAVRAAAHVDTEDGSPSRLDVRNEAPLALEVVALTSFVVTTPSPTAYGVSIVHALLWPGAVHEGDNDIGMYVLDGPADAPSLHALEVTATPE